MKLVDVQHANRYRARVADLAPREVQWLTLQDPHSQYPVLYAVVSHDTRTIPIASVRWDALNSVWYLCLRYSALDESILPPEFGRRLFRWRGMVSDKCDCFNWAPLIHRIAQPARWYLRVPSAEYHPVGESSRAVLDRMSPVFATTEPLPEWANRT